MRFAVSKLGTVLVLFAILGFESPAIGFTEIEVRKDRDGAGPSHIFHLHDNVVAVVDPLDGTISAYGDAQGAPLKTTYMPTGFRPWRIVRQSMSVSILSEDGKAHIDVARDQTKWQSELAVATQTTSVARYQNPAIVRTRSGLMLKAFEGEGALFIRPIGPHYLASARELERFGDGRRYVLWKEYYLSEPPADRPDEQRIEVDVYVGRFERDRRLSGIAPLPLAAMSRVGFDYATIMPDGTVALLASLISNHTAGPFKIYGLHFQVPSTYLAGLQKVSGRPQHWASPPIFSEPFPLIEPADARILKLGDERQPAAPDFTQGAAMLTRSDLRKQMDAYRNHRWKLTDENLRNPCEAVIVPGVPIDCSNKDRFVRPPELLRASRPVVMRGLPYDWGGADLLEQFDLKIQQGYTAGNIGGTFWSEEARRVTAGVDCSGFASNVWRLGRHVPTSELSEVTRRVETLQHMRVGDALLLPEHHIALYRGQVKTDGASLAIRVTEATSRCGSVCDSVYEIDHFNGFALRRLKTLRAQFPIQTVTRISSSRSDSAVGRRLARNPAVRPAALP